MLILESEQVKYCRVVRRLAGKLEKVPGVNYRGLLFAKIAGFEVDQLESAIKKCREFLDLDDPIASIIVKEKDAITVWTEEGKVTLADNQTIGNPETVDLKPIIEEIRSPGGIEIKGRMYKIKLYQRCFVGKDLIDWLVNRYDLSRSEALTIGKRLVDEKIVHHVTDEHPFKDDSYLYRFYEDEGKSIWTDKIF